MGKYQRHGLYLRRLVQKSNTVIRTCSGIWIIRTQSIRNLNSNLCVRTYYRAPRNTKPYIIPANNLWSRRSSEDLLKIFDLAYLKILEWGLISKIFQIFLNDLWCRRFSENPWKIFDLEDLPKNLEWSLNSNSLLRSFNDFQSRRSSEYLRFRKSFEDSWMISDIEDLPKVIEWSLISKILEWSLISKTSGRPLKDLWMIFELEGLPKIFEWYLT